MARVYHQDKLYSIIFDAVSFSGKRVLDVGCGDGEYTLKYAGLTEETVGIDPDEDSISLAQESTPSSIRSKIRFITTSLEEFSPADGSSLFDIVLFGWSL